MTEQNLETELDNLVIWSNETKLFFNSIRTKLMVVASKQTTLVHKLDDKVTKIRCEDKHLEEELRFKLIATALDNNLGWGNHIH